MSGSREYDPKLMRPDGKGVDISALIRDENRVTLPTGIDGEEEGVRKPRPRACDRIRDAIKTCVKESDCVLISRKTATQCVREEDLPRSCERLFNALYHCKRSMVL